MGILSAAMFFVLSNSKPLDKLSAQRPHPNIWCVYVFASLLGQFLVHVTFLAWCYNAAKATMPPVRPTHPPPPPPPRPPLSPVPPPACPFLPHPGRV